MTILKQAALLRHFIPKRQYAAIMRFSMGEEGEWFTSKLDEIARILETMPRVYQQSKLGDQAVAYLHYFAGGCDWWITERDKTSAQHQAFGLANLGYGGELGYVSIAEMLDVPVVEIDLHWKPKTIAEIKGGD